MSDRERVRKGSLGFDISQCRRQGLGLDVSVFALGVSFSIRRSCISLPRGVCCDCMDMNHLKRECSCLAESPGTEAEAKRDTRAFRQMKISFSRCLQPLLTASQQSVHAAKLRCFLLFKSASTVDIRQHAASRRRLRECSTSKSNTSSQSRSDTTIRRLLFFWPDVLSVAFYILAPSYLVAPPLVTSHWSKILLLVELAYGRFHVKVNLKSF